MVIDVLEEKLLSRIRELPQEEQQRVLDFANALGQSSAKLPKANPVYGLLKDEGIDISIEDFKELRREMWAKFPRESASDLD